MPKPGKSDAPESTLHASALKRVLFFAITISIPILLFVFVEIGLRVFHYGSGLDLVIQKEINGKTVYAINRSVARRYFAYAGTVIPEPADDSFAIKKPKNTKRIFCLGESTMAGFPYEFNATAPSFLRDRLRLEFPQYNFEVINVGLSAISSYVVEDFVNDLVNYDPDLFIVYLGHNEFYGVYGSGSSIQVPGGYWVTQLSISMLRFKSFLLIRDTFAWLKGKLFNQAQKSKGTLMEQMVGNQYIPYGSPTYNQTRSNFGDNVRAIIDAVQSRGIPVIFSSLVSNLKDAPPFHPQFSEATESKTRDFWKEQLTAGDSLEERKDFAGAAKYFYNCTKIDSMNAEAFFRLGRAQYELGGYANALKSFNAAKDLDGLRFRASEEFGQTLRMVCAKRGAILAPVDSAFVVNSEHGIIGKELVLEHLHPNIDGYFLMGKVFAQTIREHRLLFPPPVWDSAAVSTDQQCRSISGVTDFDVVMGNIKVDLLTHKWPFTVTDSRYSYVPRNEVEAIAMNYVLEKIIWSSARYAMADYDASGRNFSGARAECYAISKVIPFSYQPLLRIADYYRMEGKLDSATSAYVKCYQTEDNPYARLKLAVVLLQGNKTAEAIQQIQDAISVSLRKGIVLINTEESFAYYLLGVANAKLGKFNLAQEYATHALAVDPTSAEAKSLLSQLQSLQHR